MKPHTHTHTRTSTSRSDDGYFKRYYNYYNILTFRAQRPNVVLVGNVSSLLCLCVYVPCFVRSLKIFLRTKCNTLKLYLLFLERECETAERRCWEVRALGFCYKTTRGDALLLLSKSAQSDCALGSIRMRCSYEMRAVSLSFANMLVGNIRRNDISFDCICVAIILTSCDESPLG